MTRFEEVGVQLQLSSRSVNEACKRLKYSCRVCTSRGIRIPCDRCAISTAHISVCACILDEDGKALR